MEMTCPVCEGSRTLQQVHDEWDSALDNQLCRGHKRELDELADFIAKYGGTEQ